MKEEYISKFFLEIRMSEAHFGIGVNFQSSRRCIEGGDFGDVVVFTLTFFLLELERDTANGATLDTLHQVGGEAGDFVA